MKSLLFLGLLAAACLGAERPNIVFIFSDDHALNAISAYGGRLMDVAPTPNLDRIAAQGALFTRSYCSNSICGPSRAAILTGKHSHINGYVDNNTSSFDGTQTTFPKLLQKAGYQTAIVGKWHLVSDPTGFDHWEVLPGQGSYYNPDFKTASGRTHYEGYCTDIITDRAIEWLDNQRDQDKPFMLMCQHKAPHRNWAPASRHLKLFNNIEMPEPETLFDDYENRSVTLKQQSMTIAGHMSWAHDMKFHGKNLFPDHFVGRMGNGEYQRMTDGQKQAWDAAYEPKNRKFIADMRAGILDENAVTRWKYQRYIKDYLRTIRAVDENVGRLLTHLDESGLTDNTIVIYSSDQGFYLGEHGWYDKRWMFEESLAMPFLIRWPGVIKAGSVSETMIQNIDYAPTFLELAGAEIPQEIQGRSLVPVFKASGAEPDGWREGIYYFYSGERTHQVAAHDGVRDERYKLMYFPESGEWNLFDLESDPNEMNSVHDDPEYRGTLEKMKRLYDKLRSQFRMSEATLPAHRLEEDRWKSRHQQKVREAREGDHEVVFVGDSITEYWETTGKDVWDENYADRHALNLGYSGDRTEHVLWRLMSDEFQPTDPKLIVLMIGTNNTGHREDPAEKTAEGVDLILKLLRDRKPGAEILLVSTFPRGADADDRLRRLNAELNERLEKFAGAHGKIHWLDVTDVFLNEDGTLPEEIMPDALHPGAEGYRLWAEAMEPTIKELLGE